MNAKKIIIVASPGELTNILYHGISKRYEINKVVIEEKPPLTAILKRRIKKKGVVKVIGQLTFRLFIYTILRAFSKKRIQEIQTEYDLSIKSIPSEKITYVTSINTTETIALLQKLSPELIVVSGTRIISEKVLSSVNAEWFNIHTGITPLYRGVHGGYWAITNHDKENCGVTIHKVDKGIDTGSILAQNIIRPQKNDNFYTYPYLQYAIGIHLFHEVITNFYTNTLSPLPAKTASRLWHHPTAWEYLYNYLFRRAQ
jgi:methionyl-tRNA formyltransferase